MGILTIAGLIWWKKQKYEWKLADVLVDFTFK